MKDRGSARQLARILGGTIAIASIALILSCSGEGIASFTWKSSLDQGQVFSQTAHFPKGQENLLSQARPQNSFMLRKAMTVEPGFMIAASVKVKRDGLGIGFSLSPRREEGGPRGPFCREARQNDLLPQSPRFQEPENFFESASFP